MGNSNEGGGVISLSFTSEKQIRKHKNGDFKMWEINYEFAPCPETGTVRGRTSDFEYRVCAWCHKECREGRKDLIDVLNESSVGTCRPEIKNCWHVEI